MDLQWSCRAETFDAGLGGTAAVVALQGGHRDDCVGALVPTPAIGAGGKDEPVAARVDIEVARELVFVADFYAVGEALPHFDLKGVAGLDAGEAAELGGEGG